MTKIPHQPHHWIPVALVIAAALFTLTEVHGQVQTGAGAVFEGRPAMAGAQAGTGAMAGPPQGGIGVQGSEDSQFTLRRKTPASPAAVTTPRTDMLGARGEVEVAPAKDTSVAPEQRSAVKKSKKAAKRVVQRKRHGVSPIDAEVR